MIRGREIVGERTGGPGPKSELLRPLRNPEPEKFCKNCSKPVPPNRTIDGHPNRGFTMMNNDPNRLFCTQRCAVICAVAMWNKYKAPR